MSVPAEDARVAPQMRSVAGKEFREKKKKEEKSEKNKKFKRKIKK